MLADSCLTLGALTAEAPAGAFEAAAVARVDVVPCLGSSSFIEAP